MQRWLMKMETPTGFTWNQRLTAVCQRYKQGLVCQVSLGNSVGCLVDAPQHLVLDSHLKVLVPGKKRERRGSHCGGQI